MSAQVKSRGGPPPPPPPKAAGAMPLRVVLGDGEATTLKRDPNAKLEGGPSGPPPLPSPDKLRSRGQPRMPVPRSLAGSIPKTRIGQPPPPPTRPPSVPAGRARAAQPSRTVPIRLGPDPAPVTSRMPRAAELRRPELIPLRSRPAADFVSSEALPTLPNVDGLLRKQPRAPKRRRWRPIAVALATFAAVATIGAAVLLILPAASTPGPQEALAASSVETTPAEIPAEVDLVSDPARARAATPTPTEPIAEAPTPTPSEPPPNPESAASPDAPEDTTAASPVDAAPAPSPKVPLADALPPAPSNANERVPSPEDANLAKARKSLASGRSLAAYNLASQSFDEHPSRAALLLMVEAGCKLGSFDRARAAYSKLPLSSRAPIRTQCLELGLELGA